MKKIVLTIFVFLLGIIAKAQDYQFLENINYYDKNTTDYQKSQCLLDFYYPKNHKNFATVIWFHGGGITGGKKEIPEAIKNNGFAVIGVGYRLSPNVKAPTYIEDAAAAVAWAFHNVEQYGGNKKLIFVTGHSAGGYLGMMIGFDKKYLKKHAVDANEIAGLIPFSGQAVTHFTIRKEKGIPELQPIIDEYSPLFFVRKDLPPLLLITGDRELEIMGRYEENAYLERMMKLVKHENTRLFELDGFNHSEMAEPAFPLLIKEVKQRSQKILKE
ncbi:alpha/beta hydrolase fold domain-containing protein [Flavobacterium sp. NST-5]|uniref:Alpha/beta hydrolase fold domain-containing protein n=1 Tax=Flavobacterium ichthyis TaxID=2698827 RepID=A0ABW9Z4N5_9FLAO|nr:alpha/beta hydrolase [Flavobacterium ichthyis]NBL63801.1 alpha/beta hydrolase fold domain-containing protein [Flavobacterium ichthyis]